MSDVIIQANNDLQGTVLLLVLLAIAALAAFIFVLKRFRRHSSETQHANYQLEIANREMQLKQHESESAKQTAVAALLDSQHANEDLTRQAEELKEARRAALNMMQDMDMTNKKIDKQNQDLAHALARGKLATNELQNANEKLEELASTDKLTGLPNRAVFLDRLDQKMKQARRDKSRFAVLFFDFDRFKVVNDSLGHSVGDALLCDIADIFCRELRDTDTVARFGGDEFVVMLGDLTDWSDAENKADKLLQAFAAPHQLGDHLVVSTEQDEHYHHVSGRLANAIYHRQLNNRRFPSRLDALLLPSQLRAN